jgi:four helix bundle protein
MLKHYKDLKVRQKSYEFCLEIYRITAKFPKEERYGLTSQTRSSVVSIPSNIAEIERMLKELIKSLENKPLNP